MDPLTALGLASNVLSFVSFASGLIKGTVEISASATGCPIDVTRLDSVCQRLEDLCSGLQFCIEYEVPQACDTDERNVANTFGAVKSLCSTCKADADELLGITKTLRTKHGSRGKWASFRVAFKKAWEKSSIDELEARLSRTQTTMTLHICTLVHYCSRAQSKRLEGLQQQSLFLQADQAKAIGRISDGINYIQQLLQPGIDLGHPRHQRDHLTVSEVQCLHEKLQSLSLYQKDVKKQQTILESLTFESRPMRHRQIPAAHKETFQWALMIDQDPSLGPSLGNWLRKGDGIFWVTGKAGSGKSTLMKYIADSSITARFVNEWARTSRVAIVSHYFWITGTSMQKSQQGLLQTLLYDIFRQCPDLIAQTCEQRWENAGCARSWKLAELHQALQTVVASNDAEIKICFIIDGLDEYSGDHEDRTQLCRTLKDLATSRNVKLCLSSRPWNIFEEEFGLEYSKLYMQDLTRGDIENYVSSRLEEHTRWATVSANHFQGQKLISEIAKKSNGVFLWVFLVTKLLREGLMNRDTLVDLRRRVNSFPSELEPFFKIILEAVEPFYHSHMSTALQIANTATESHLSFLVYNFHFQEYENRDYAITHPIRVMEQAEIDEIQNNTSWYLDSRTRGLLEINPEDGTVAFLHRTARDFLNTQEMYDFLATKADSSLEFVPMLSIIKAHVAMLKSSSLPNRIIRRSFGNFETANCNGETRPHVFQSRMKRFMRFASELESHMTGDARHHALLDELDRTLLCMISEANSGGHCTILPASWSRMERAFFREQLVIFKLFGYLRSKLDSEPSFLKDIGTLPVVWFVSTGGYTTHLQFHRGDAVKFLVCLLRKRGIDPNKPDRCSGLSPWNEIFTHICRWWHAEPKSTSCLLSILLEEGILKLYLRARADPSTHVAESSLVPGICWSRAAAAVYLEFCFDVLDQNPTIQTLYLEVLSDILQISSEEVLKHVANEFCMIVGFWNKERLCWNLPFFAEVINILQRSLVARGIGTAGSLYSLDEVGTKVFPSNLYTPMNIAAESSGRERK